MFAQWRALLAERVEEATRILGAVPGVRGLVVGGSVGRGEAWPLSDIDILPIRPIDAAAEIERRRADLVDWWAASGREQTLDVGSLAFTEEEVTDAIASGPRGGAARMHDRRWFHGIDKACGGYGAGDPGGAAEAFAQWATTVRFAPDVIAARVAEWRRQALAAHEQALRAEDPREATVWLRDAARCLRLVLIEGWGERLGSMGREWTRFERIAERHGAAHLAGRIAFVAAADLEAARADVALAPTWLSARIACAYAARLEAGEAVSADENAREQIAAFRVHVVRRRPDLGGDWLRLPDPAFDAKMAELERLLSETGATGAQR